MSPRNFPSDTSIFFKVFLKHSRNIYSVTPWGLDDGSSWLNGFPVRGRTNHPLLFDRQLKAKSCYDALVEIKKPGARQNTNRNISGKTAPLQGQ